MEIVSNLVIPILLGIATGCFVDRIEKENKFIFGLSAVIAAIFIFILAWLTFSSTPTNGLTISENMNVVFDKTSIYRFDIFDLAKIFCYFILIEFLFGVLIGFCIKRKKYFFSIVGVLVFLIVLMYGYSCHDYIVGVKYYNLYQEKGDTDNYLILAEESFKKSYEKMYKESSLMLGTISIEKGELDEAEEYLIIANELGFKTKKAEAYYYYCIAYIDYKRWREDTGNEELFNKVEECYKKSLELYSNRMNVSNVGLGYLYWEKWEEDKSNVEYFNNAEKALKESFDKGNLNVCYELGYLYALMWEEDKNNIEYFNDAEKYFNIALKNSNLKENAQQMLDYLYYVRDSKS